MRREAKTEGLTVVSKFEDPQPAATTSFSQSLGAVPNKTCFQADMKEVMQSSDQVFVVFFYDSLDVNSHKIGRRLGEAADLLKGFATVATFDVAVKGNTWVRDALAVT
eukprot:gene18718-6128_t